MCDWKEPFYKVARQDSRNMAKIGNALGWDWLEQEGKRNTDNPGRAIGKAAQYAATWYLGGPAWGAAGSGASAAGTTAAEEATKVAAEEAAKQAALEMAQQEMLNSAQYAGQRGLLSVGEQAIPQGVANTMEAGLMDTGYTPSSLWNALRYGGNSGQSVGKTLANYGTTKFNNAVQGLKNGGGQKFAKRYATQQALGMLNPQPQQRPAPYQPPPQEEYQPQPLYGSGGGIYGLTEEEKQRLRQMGFRV